MHMPTRPQQGHACAMQRLLRPQRRTYAAHPPGWATQPSMWELPQQSYMRVVWAPVDRMQQVGVTTAVDVVPVIQGGRLHAQHPEWR